MKEKLKKEIIDLLSDSKAREAIDIIKELGYGKDLDFKIMETIQEMVNEYDLYMTKHNRYLNFQDSELAKELKKGYFETPKGEYGFVTVADLEENVFIPSDSKQTALNGDLVLLQITNIKPNKNDNEKKYTGKILKVLKRSKSIKVGEVIIYNNKKFVKLTSSKSQDLFYLEGDIERLVPGDLITIKINNDKKYPSCTYLKRLGHKNDPGIDILAILADHEFDVEFPKDVLDELKNIPTEVRQQDLEDRVDLRDEEIFTIDGEDTKDIDDAISLKILPDETYQLSVHIADVSYYVKEGSPLDKEARKRGTSVYLADRVVPMLPHQLSNGICSLNPNVDRLTITCQMIIDQKGNLKNYHVFKSVIRSRKQMTYENVNKIFENNEIPIGYEDFEQTLIKMQKLATIVRNNKINKGYIDFDVDEAKIIIDEEGNVLDIKKRYRGTGEKLIEDFMILANEAIATYIGSCSLPSIYRVHGNVNQEKLQKFIGLLSTMNINIKNNLNNVNQKTIQKIINEIKKQCPDCFQVLSSYMLSCMAKAKYQTNNIGHFALALRNYTHFTSPIRRYPDTIIHRLLHNYFLDNKILNEELIRHFESILDEICLTSSERERASMECEREVFDLKTAEYMEKHIGEVYEGRISGITSFGIFVVLDNLVEGMIRLDTFNEKMYYDEEKEMLIGGSSHKIYTIGTKLTIKVVKANKDLRQIDFEEVKEEEDEKEEKKVKKVTKKY